MSNLASSSREKRRPRPDPRLRHADHQHARRNVHAAALHADRCAHGARHPRIRRLGRDIRRDPHRTGVAALRALQAGHALFGIRQCRRPDGDVSQRRRRRPANRICANISACPMFAAANARSSPPRRARPSRPIRSILAQRIDRDRGNGTGKPEKGDDILLSVITDGRHTSIDMRFVLPDYDDEPEQQAQRPDRQCPRDLAATPRERRYTRPDGIPYALPGAAQMIFSDLGTLNVEATRGFSAYRWIKTQLIERGVPPARSPSCRITRNRLRSSGSSPTSMPAASASSSARPRPWAPASTRSTA